MANLNIKNLVKELFPSSVKDPAYQRHLEGFIEEGLKTENFYKFQHLTSIVIENFKCIGDAVTIPIRPITLLFGKNSSGKSTVLQALRYGYKIWQGKLSSHISMSGGFNIDFSDFPSLVHGHDLDRKIRIRIEYTFDPDTQYPTYEFIEVITGWKDGRGDIVSWLWGISKNNEELIRSSLGSLEALPSDKILGSSGEELIRLKEKKGFPKLSPEIYVNTNNIHKNSIDFYLNIIKYRLRHQQELTESSSDSSFDLDIRHLGPFREVPQMLDNSWEKGIGAWNTLARDPELLKETNRYMRDILKLGYTISDITLDSQEKSNITLDMNSEIMEKLKKICNSEDIRIDELKKQVYDPLVLLSRRPMIKLHDENENIEVGLSDIGIGIAQIIPVVVGTLDDSHGIFLVEQPELHIHPAVQVALGDVFIGSIKTKQPFLDDSLFEQQVEQEISFFFTKGETYKKFLSKFISKLENSPDFLDKKKNINAPASLYNISFKIGDLIIDGIKIGQECFDLSLSLQEASDKFLSEMENSFDLSLSLQEASDKLLSNIENSKEDLLDIKGQTFKKEDLLASVKNINDPANDPAFYYNIIDLIKDSHQDILIVAEGLNKKCRELGKKHRKELLSRGKNSNRTLLIETHSEHLLLRLLRRVRETTRRSRRQTTDLEQTAHELTPDDLSVVYVRPTPAGVKFTPLTVTADGDFDAPWPEGFFDERDSELF